MPEPNEIPSIPAMKLIGEDAVRNQYGKAKKGMMGWAWRATFKFWKAKLAIIACLIVAVAFGWVQALILAVLAIALIIWSGRRVKAAKAMAK